MSQDGAGNRILRYGLYVKTERKTTVSTTASSSQGFRSCMFFGANIGVAIWITGTVFAVTMVRLTKGRHALLESNLAYIHVLGFGDLV